MGITEGSAENVTEEDVKEDNKQLQLKVQKNEKLIQKLHLEQSEHENVLKVSILFDWNLIYIESQKRTNQFVTTLSNNDLYNALCYLIKNHLRGFLVVVWVYKKIVFLLILTNFSRRCYNKLQK